MRHSFPSSLSLLALAVSYAHSAPAGPQTVNGGSVLGSSFGVPGNQTFDYVIIGGGTAGLALANRLSENPAFSVAVIEAGGFYELDNSNISQIPLYAGLGTDKAPGIYNPLIDWGFATVPQEGADNSVIHYARGKCLGGSSARNYMAYQIGTKKSYDMWAEAVGDTSYSWDSLSPYFKKSQDFGPPDRSKRAANATPEYDPRSLRSGGPLAVTFSNYAQGFASWVQKGLAEIGIKPTAGFTSGSLFGSSYVLETIQPTIQIRESSETAFLEPALKRSNLIVFKQSLAKRILFDGNKVATGVLVDTEGAKYTLSAKKELILSAGAFQSPQLLMVSGVGPAATLQKYGIPVVADRSGVGQNMWDHVFFGPSYRTNVITASSLGNPQFASQAVSDFVNKQTGILTNSGGDFFAWEKLPSASRKTLSNSTLSSLASFPSDWPEIEYLSVATYMGDNWNYGANAPRDSYNYAAVVSALVAPLSRGTVSISSADTSDPPVIDPRWLTHPADQAVAVAAYKRVRELFATKAMAPALIGEAYPGLNGTQTDGELLAVIRKSFHTVWHAACTCRMGKKDDPKAVVDSSAKVIGVQGLRVVDASAFAILPPGHPMSTVYALAEKIADNIKGVRSY
ncbi:MAG: hypothetical protein M1816_007904 [Peltula sp. TS41687]|nr:MAG: hypothetical protein M1816_007904 [Peltula sp. TS41687]